MKLLLALPPPPPPGSEDDPDRLDLLRSLWFAYEGSSKELAAQLEISPPHLIRLLRGDRRPRRALRERIEGLAGSLPGLKAKAGRGRKGLDKPLHSILVCSTDYTTL